MEIYISNKYEIKVARISPKLDEINPRLIYHNTSIIASYRGWKLESYGNI